MDGKLKSIHGAWIPAIHAGMTTLDCVMMKSDKVELSTASHIVAIPRNREEPEKS
jgi:hypothetical protein